MLFDPLRHCYQYCLPDLTLAQTEKSAGRGKHYSDNSFQTDMVFLIDDRRIKKIVVVAEVAAVLQDVEMNTHCYYWEHRNGHYTVSWSGPSHYGSGDHCKSSYSLYTIICHNTAVWHGALNHLPFCVFLYATRCNLLFQLHCNNSKLPPLITVNQEDGGKEWKGSRQKGVPVITLVQLYNRGNFRSSWGQY